MATEGQAAKRGLSSLTKPALAAELAARSQPAFRAGQLFSWLHAKRATRFEEMTNLPLALRNALAEDFTIERPAIERVQQSADGTRKYLLSLSDGHRIEAVRMEYRHGASLCISSQVGCRMGCRFCASTKGGLVRGLTAGEMAGEVYAVLAETEEPISSIVLMGVGEPLDNFEAVTDFVSLITDPDGLGLSGRSISLSTCGLVPGIEKLAALRLPLTLSVSLHAADDATRSGLMPVNDRWPIASLMAACARYREETGRRISYEYTLVRGVNDGPADAEKLAALLRGSDGHVNLIPVNEAGREGLKATTAGEAQAFQKALAARGVNATIRRTLGADISAACGQLRAEAGSEPQ